jgi:hypothetical protein
MSVVTMRTTLRFSDAPDASLYGFPLPYWRFGGVSSLEYVVDPIALAVDLALHVAVAMGLLWRVRRRTSTISAAWRIPLYVVAALVVAAQAWFVSGMRPVADDATDPPTRVDVSLHVGLDRPY